MNDVFRAAAEIERFCRARAWRFCFIGGLAVQRWADPRQTEDADLTLLTGFHGEEKFVDELLTAFRPRAADERSRALLRRVVLAWSSEGIRRSAFAAAGGLCSAFDVRRSTFGVLRRSAFPPRRAGCVRRSRLGGQAGFRLPRYPSFLDHRRRLAGAPRT